jgi:hypothetical protein
VRHACSLTLTVVGTLVLFAFAPAVSSASSRGDSNFAKLVLRPAQIGPGFRLKERPDSYKVRGYVTLDVCGFRFPSEKLRTRRIQVDYARRGKVELSNEVVKYRRGGASQALREVAWAADHCPREAVPSPVAGVPPLTYRVRVLAAGGPRSHPYVYLLVKVSGKVKGKTRSESAYAFYQIRHDVLSAVYVQGGTPSALRLASNAVAASANNLDRWA